MSYKCDRRPPKNAPALRFGSFLQRTAPAYPVSEAWTDVAGSPIDGGHAILGGGYKTDVRFITWAQETRFATSSWNGVVQGTPLVDEAWIVVRPEHLGTAGFEQGVDQAQLAADYRALTGDNLVLSA